MPNDLMHRTTAVYEPKTEYLRLVLDAETWLLQAHQFLLTAKALEIQASPPLPRSADGNALQVGKVKSALLLVALAVENAMKGVRAAQRAIVIKNGRIVTASFGAGRSGHDLLLLAQACALPITRDESAFLKRLTSVLLWAGRYPQPVNEFEHLAAIRENPRTLTHPHDFKAAFSFVERAKNLADSYSRDALYLKTNRSSSDS